MRAVRPRRNRGLDPLRSVPMRTVLFVCTGNTCRSPMAEGIAQKLSDEGRLPSAIGPVFWGTISLPWATVGLTVP